MKNKSEPTPHIKKCKETTVDSRDPVIRKIRTTDNTHLSPRFMETMKDFCHSITQFRVENNMINNDPESIENDFTRGLLENADMVSRCIGNVAPITINIEEEKKRKDADLKKIIKLYTKHN